MRSLILAVFLVFLFSTVLIADEKESEDVPIGMEVLMLNKVKHIVPKGTKVYERDGVQVLEGRNEYMAGRFEAIFKRLTSLEKSEKELTSEIKQLKETIDELQASNEEFQLELINLKQDKELTE